MRERRAVTPAYGGPQRAAPPSLPSGRRPLRLAHRGAATRAPENTLAAFEEAIRLGVDAIELDVRLSADGKPVVIHDETVDRTSDGRGAVARLRLAELRRLDAGSWFDPRFRGEKIPTLAEALECARGRCGLNLELKGVEGRGQPEPGTSHPSPTGFALLARAVASELSRARFEDLLVISSFSIPALVVARAAMPRRRLGYLASRSLRGLRALHERVGLTAVHPHVRLASARRVRAAHALGLAVFFWTVNDVRLMRRLVRLGGDGLMTDDPALFGRLDERPPMPADGPGTPVSR